MKKIEASGKSTGWQDGASNRRLHQKPAKSNKPGAKGAYTRPRPRPKSRLEKDRLEALKTQGVAEIKEVKEIVETATEQPKAPRPFRVLIAVHRPRYRGRVERAAALVGWEVLSLLNKQDAVGQVTKSSGSPDLFILSGDFGRQKDYAIFRAVQAWREKGMKLIGLVDDAAAAPPAYPDSAPIKTCDVCLQPPYKMAELRDLFAKLYEEIRHKKAPPPISAAPAENENELEEDLSEED